MNEFIRVGVTSGVSKTGAEGNYTHVSVPTAYTRSLYKAGADAVYILPSYSNTNKIEQLVDQLDGVLLTGGIDIGTENYGQIRKEYTDYPDVSRDKFETEIAKTALQKDLPILGICRGLQLINTIFGGTLYQDILKESPGEKIHNIKDETEISHEVHIKNDSILKSIIKETKLDVNSAHHQAIKKLGEKLKATAISSDGLIEAIESINHTWVLGVQWHPELLAGKMNVHKKIFTSFINSIKNRKNMYL